MTDQKKLTAEQETATIQLFMHEREMSRLEQIIRKLWILVIVVFIALVLTNAGWIIYENQFEEIRIEQEATTDGGGSNYLNGTGEVRYYGEGEASDYDSTP